MRYQKNPTIPELNFDERLSIVKQAIVKEKEEMILLSSMTQEGWLYDLMLAVEEQRYEKLSDNAVDFCLRIVQGDYDCKY